MHIHACYVKRCGEQSAATDISVFAEYFIAFNGAKCFEWTFSICMNMTLYTFEYFGEFREHYDMIIWWVTNWMTDRNITMYMYWVIHE